MKRLWIVIVFTSLLFIPTTYSPTISESPVVVSQQAQLASDRIYGEVIVEEIYESIESDDLRYIVEKFSENGTRYLESVIDADVEGANKYARLYIIDQLERLTSGKVEIEVYGNYFNVIGKLKGYLPGVHPVFLVTAHYDSPSGCPGANCNGGGVAAMLMLAKVMSQYEWPLDIYFIALNGLYRHGEMMQDVQEGSEEVSIELEHRGIETYALYDIDTILYPHPNAPADEKVWMGYDGIGDYSRGGYWADLARTISHNYGLNYILPVPSQSFPLWYIGSTYDFYRRSYLGVLCATESGAAVDPSYQAGNDTASNPTFRYDICKEVTAAIGGSMAYVMGRTYGEPREFRFSFELRPGRSERFYIPITVSTNLAVSCRWFGGSATFRIENPTEGIVEFAEFNNASAWEFTEVFDTVVTERNLHTLTITCTGDYPVGFDLIYSHDSDIDRNGILDSQEFWIASAYFSSDVDSDGLSAAEELFLGTSDNNIDSDSDTMDDKYEVDNGFDPTDPSDGAADFDGDTLTNAEEYSLGLNPWSADTDLDKIPDNWELEHGLNPLVNDASNDPDEDGKTNLDEYLDDTDPHVKERESLNLPWYAVPSIALVSLIIVVSWIVHQESKMI